MLTSDIYGRMVIFKFPIQSAEREGEREREREREGAGEREREREKTLVCKIFSKYLTIVIMVKICENFIVNY